jgi:O-antigen ligase
MLEDWKQQRFKVEVGLLLALCFFLPLLEQPKNLAWLAFVVTWIVNRVRSRDFGGAWSRWDTLFLLWIGSGIAVAAAAQLGEIRDAEWKGARDLFRYGTLAWLVSRGGYSAPVRRWLLATLVISTLVALAVGYARLWTGIGRSGTLQLYSVGHVNHTAIYLAIMLGLWAAWLFAGFRSWRTAARVAGCAAFAVLFVSLAFTASRAAVGGGIAALIVLAVAFLPRWRAPLLIVLGGVAAVVLGAIALDAELIRKQARYEMEGIELSQRGGIWRMGVAGWARHPWLGVGMGNYQHITPDRVKAWRAEAGQDYDPKRYVHFPHGHSLYINTLAERGAIGFAILAAVLLAWGVQLLRGRPAAAAADDDWTLWGASAVALVVTLAAGLFNTTLHHEHGLLAALLLGLWLDRRKARAAS